METRNQVAASIMIGRAALGYRVLASPCWAASLPWNPLHVSLAGPRSCKPKPS